MSDHPVWPWFTEARRAWIYRILLAASALSVIYGILSDAQAVAWVGLAAAVIGNTSATVNTSTKR